MTVDELILALRDLPREAKVQIKVTDKDEAAWKDVRGDLSGVENHTACTHDCKAIGQILIR